VTLEAPFYQRPSFWLGPFMWGLGLIIAVGLGIGWYMLGGFPRDHDKYGEVAVPGGALLFLPEGDVRLNFENHATRSGDSTHLDDQPAGLKVQVIRPVLRVGRSLKPPPPYSGERLPIDDVPSWLFSSTSGDRGHEPYGKVDIPSDGDYLVSASVEGQPAPPPKPVTTAGRSIDEGSVISVGQSPWTPGDSKLLGAILCGVVVFGVVLLLTLPFRLFIKD
jgi:hypothetical protein